MMKKEYIIPSMDIFDADVSPLLVLSYGSDMPSTEVNHEEFDGEFSGRGFDMDE